MKFKYLLLATLLAAAPAWAQPKAAAVGQSIEALVTVVAVDKKARTVVIRGPRGNTEELAVPKEAQNFDKIKQGDVFRMRYTEAVAVAITKGGEPSKGDAKGMTLAKKGDNPGGVATRTRYVSGKIEAIDYQTRHVAIRGPKQTISLKAADDIKLEELHAGDRITIAYSQALAIEMVPAPAKPKPKPKAAPKKE
jgi:Cu/Ag efflux protein CusF